MEVSCVHYMLQVIRLRVHTEFCLSPSKLNPHPTSLLRDVRDLLTHANSEEEKIYECLFSAFYSVRQHIKVFCNPVIIKLIMTNKKQENKIAMQIISRTYSTNVLINCPHHHAKCQIWPETKLRKCARKSHRVTGAIHTHTDMSRLSMGWCVHTWPSWDRCKPHSGPGLGRGPELSKACIPQYAIRCLEYRAVVWQHSRQMTRLEQ